MKAVHLTRRFFGALRPGAPHADDVAWAESVLGPDAFGHSGAAGAQAFDDPRRGVTYGYVRRRFPYPPEGGAPENHRLAAAVIQCATAP